MKLVLFDCDGTLVDSAGTIHECMTRTFSAAGLPAPGRGQTRQIIGLSLHLAMERLLGPHADADIPALVSQYKDNFLSMRGEPEFQESLFDGIAGMLAELRMRSDLVLGMVTGKSRRGVRSVVATHGFDGMFMTVRTADDCPSKPHPAMVLECCCETGIEPAETVVIGDTVYDIEMAGRAGAKAIGVSWGYHDAGALLSAGAADMASAPAMIPALI